MPKLHHRAVMTMRKFEVPMADEEGLFGTGKKKRSVSEYV